MERQEIFEKVQAIVAEHLDIEREKVEYDFSLFEGIRREKTASPPYRYPWEFFSTPLSSFSVPNSEEVEIHMALEEEFNIEIPDEAILEKILTVQHAVDYVISCL